MPFVRRGFPVSARTSANRELEGVSHSKQSCVNEGRECYGGPSALVLDTRT